MLNTDDEFQLPSKCQNQELRVVIEPDSLYCGKLAKGRSMTLTFFRLFPKTNSFEILSYFMPCSNLMNVN